MPCKWLLLKNRLAEDIEMFVPKISNFFMNGASRPGNVVCVSFHYDVKYFTLRLATVRSTGGQYFSVAVTHSGTSG